MRKQIQKDLLQARKDKDDVRKSILSVLMGEIQLEESRTNKALDNSGIVKHIKKLKKSCDEMVSRGDAGSQAESDILLAYLPQEMTVVDIITAIRNEEGLVEEINSAPNRMALMGKVMGVLKKDGRPFDGKVVSVTLQQIK